MTSIRLRGIYSFALGALLQDRGWKIVQPPEELQVYFQAECPPQPFAVDVRDRDDLQGIVATGSSPALQQLRETLSEELPDVISYSAPVALEAIYVGLVQRRSSCGYEIDLGNKIGFLANAECNGALRSGEALCVQIKGLSQAGQQAMLTRALSVAGQFAVLSANSGIGISKEIKDLQERERLAQLGKRWALRNWGIIWRTAAWGRDEAELHSEIESLKAMLARLDDHPHDGIPGLLWPGTPTVIVEFPGASKRALDRWRAPTPEHFGATFF